MLNEIEKKALSRIEELILKADRLVTTQYLTGVIGAPTYVDGGLFAEWKSQTLSFLINFLGAEDNYVKQFTNSVTESCRYDAESGRGILKALKEDISKEYLTKFKNLVTANIFSDFISMAEYLLSEKYKDAAAVIMGSVLEEHLRNLCQNRGVPITIMSGGKSIPKKADAMNADLAKAGAYNNLEMKSITAWLDLRNKAAHGKYTEYVQAQVELLINGVSDFINRIPA
ncbi:MAG: hypothetical protein A2Y12_17395 [Planctomycetes bacterium GWF2_42_9]|nr:MAG: hypothetical protein A2Y12_17395 [Planctomycetes bacterium GWF2_42_9]HAL44643.1 hypothetical protein [Phycisphaerales bacterium]